MLFRVQRNQHVQRSPNENIRNSHIYQLVKQSEKMLWGYFSHYGIGSLHSVKGMMRHPPPPEHVEIVQKESFQR